MSVDLSLHHKPLTATFDGPEDDGNCRLSPSHIEFFHENGYIAGVKILSESQIEILRSELADLMSPGQSKNPLFYEYHHNESGDSQSVLFHALGAWRISTAFHDLLFYKAFTVPASQLLGGPVRFWHDQIFVKPAHDGGIVAWHQDYSYWTRTVPMAHLTCWIGLDDSNTENGCVHYVPRSHKWDLLPRGRLANDMEEIFDVLSDEQKCEFKPVPIVLKAGEASFHHPKMIHGSYGNLSDKPRRAAVINVFRDGVRSDSDEPLLAGIPPIPKGEKIDGQFFPLIG